MGILSTHLGMLYATWIVMILIGLTMLATLVGHLRSTMDWDDIAKVVTRPVLLDLFPLLLLSWFTQIDRTHILVRIWFYGAAVAIAIRCVLSLSRLIRR